MHKLLYLSLYIMPIDKMNYICYNDYSKKQKGSVTNESNR